MINWVERKTGDYIDSPYIGAYEFTEEGDTLVVKPSTPVLGLTKILSAPVLAEEHDDPSGLFVVTVRVSLDEGLNWQGPFELSTLYSQNLGFKKNHYTVFEFTIAKKGTGASYFEGIDFEDSLQYSLPSVPEFYEDIKNSLQVPYYNHTAIQWALNVLDKMYRKGIVPSFIKRNDNHNWSDEDYINLWWSFLYPMALRIAFSNEFSDLLWNPVLLQRYLEQRGMILGNISGLDELYYLMSFFYDEMARRGTLSVFDTDRKVGEMDGVRGELARLIDMKNGSELFLGLINSYENGWWLGKSSPCNYENSDIYENYKLGYENTITSLDNYPLEGEDVWIQNGNICIEPVSAAAAGIGGDFSSGKLIPVSKDREYAIIVKFDLNITMGVDFGVKGYDSVGNQINFIDSGGSAQNSFRSGNVREGGHCFIGYIRNNSCTILGTPDGTSRVLRFPSTGDISYIVPQFKVSRDGEICTITEFQVCLLRPKFIYLESTFNKVYGMLIKNKNMNLTDEEVEKIIKTKLLPMGMDYTMTFE